MYVLYTTKKYVKINSFNKPIAIGDILYYIKQDMLCMQNINMWRPHVNFVAMKTQ